MDEAIRVINPYERLREPILVAAIRGAGSLTPGAVAELFERYEPQPLVEVNPDEFYDFSIIRPVARIVNGERIISWPEIRFSKVALEDRDIVLLSAPEPGLQWVRFGRIVREVMESYGIHEVILVSSFAGAAPHTRATPVQWLAISADAPPRFGREAHRPRYQGPATFGMALGAMLRDAGMTVGTLNAIAPFYLGVEPSPHAARALARALEMEFGLRFDLDHLDHQVAEVERQAAAQVEHSDHLRAFLQNLEQQYDEVQGVLDVTPSGPPDGDGPSTLPASEKVIADVEAYLQEHRGPGSAGGDRSRTA